MQSSSETRETDPETGGQKGSKPARFDLLPWDVVYELAEHYGRGAGKYADRNWEKGYKWSLNFAALHRHLSAWWNGQDEDPEVGSNHLAAVLWHTMAMRWFQMHGRGSDDRPKLPAPVVAWPARSIYVGGPMSGYPQHNFPAFDRAAAWLRSAGWSKVVNPADLDRELGYDPNNDPDPAMYREMMRRDIAELVQCDAIALLPYWDQSPGATTEHGVAVACGLAVIEIPANVVAAPEI